MEVKKTFFFCYKNQQLEIISFVVYNTDRYSTSFGVSSCEIPTRTDNPLPIELISSSPTEANKNVSDYKIRFKNVLLIVYQLL